MEEDSAEKAVRRNIRGSRSGARFFREALDYYSDTMVMFGPAAAPVWIEKFLTMIPLRPFPKYPLRISY